MQTVVSCFPIMRWRSQKSTQSSAIWEWKQPFKSLEGCTGTNWDPMVHEAWYNDLALGCLPIVHLQNTHLHAGMQRCSESVCFCSLPTTSHSLPSLFNIYIQTVLQMDEGSPCRACMHGHPLGTMIQLAGASVTLASWRLTAKQASHLKFKRPLRCGVRRDLPRDAVRGGSVYLPRCKQVHGDRSVESPAPGETQPAASLRHGPGCWWDYPTPSWGGVGNSRPVRVLCICVCFREKQPLRTHVNAVQTAEDELISPVWSSVPGRDCSGATAELVVPTTLLWVYGGRFMPRCRGLGKGGEPFSPSELSLHCIFIELFIYLFKKKKALEKRKHDI